MWGALRQPVREHSIRFPSAVSERALPGLEAFHKTPITKIVISESAMKKLGISLGAAILLGGIAFLLAASRLPSSRTRFGADNGGLPTISSGSLFLPSFRSTPQYLHGSGAGTVAQEIFFGWQLFISRLRACFLGSAPCRTEVVLPGKGESRAE